MFAISIADLLWKTPQVSLLPAQFVERWSHSSLSERSGSQSHFIDLCDLLGQPHPAAGDSAGERYTFEKRVRRIRGGKGFADVWMRDHFAWEYKGNHKSLEKAYIQLNDYREDLGNPPLLVVSDLKRFEVHTNFTSTTKRIYAFDLDDLDRNQVTATCPLPPLEVLRALFGDYSVLRPEYTDARVTQEAARLFSRLAERLELEERNLGASSEQVAHFLMRLLFCLFADSIGLLPDRVFRKLLQSDDRFNPKRFLRKLTSLFKAMSEPDGIFGEHTIKYFNGGLFDTASIIQLDKGDLGILYEVSKNYDWSHIAPAIFGTLFERSLDPARRSLIGAHYTSEDDIRLLIEPVLIRPLQEEWAAVKQQILGVIENEGVEKSKRSRQARSRHERKSEQLLAAWIAKLTSVRVLDPACGSGNFLYVALRRMSDLWLEARKLASEQGISLVVPNIVSPRQLYGIEKDALAHELASIVVWIGFLQWRHERGVVEEREPILQKLDNIQHADAILRYDAKANPCEPEWPKADFVIGNPPFLGGNKIRQELGDKYVDDLFTLYSGRVEPFADLVCYWFEKARSAVETHNHVRVGLLATQGIRGGANRAVLQRIKDTGDIFFAYSDKKWTLEGALVRISMLGFDNGDEPLKLLDEVVVQEINANLTAGTNITTAMPLNENSDICFMGVSPKGRFDISEDVARKMLAAPLNVNGRTNSDVVRPVLSGIDIVGHERQVWTIDFGIDMTEEEAAKYEMPFEYVRHYVLPVRSENNRASYRLKWWLFGEPRPAMRQALRSKSRYIATPATSKYRIFVWVNPTFLCNQGTLVFARDDDYFFGVLQSTLNEVWALSQGTQLESRPRYTPNTTFDTFPFPWPPGTEPREEHDPRVKAIADAARELVRLRNAWLNPPGASVDELKKRTLTNLYNERPEWLANAHLILDAAVAGAYGLVHPLSREEILAHLLKLNLDRAAGKVRIPVPVADLPPKKMPQKDQPRPTNQGKNIKVK